MIEILLVSYVQYNLYFIYIFILIIYLGRKEGTFDVYNYRMCTFR